jgi:beta-lactamase regulating signal transducer with metallopeptidase domain
MNASSFFSGLIRASWQASVLVVLVLAIQWIFRRRLTARGQYTLWFLVLIRLALPSLPSSAWSIYNCAPPIRLVKNLAATVAANPVEVSPILPQHGKSAVSESGSFTDQGSSVILPEDHLSQPAAKDPASYVAAIGWRKIAMSVWLAGVPLLVSRMAMQNLLFALRLRDARDVVDEEARRLFEACKETLGVRSVIPLRTTALVKSPALCGLFRPALLLPEGFLARFNPTELRHIFLHELAHVQRRDMAVNWLATALGILHWPNPVLWFAFRRMAMDRELASDELALSHAGERENRAYGETVIRVLELCAQPAELPGLIGIVEGKGQMIRRLSMIARFRQQKRWSALAAGLAFALALVTFTDARPDRASDPQAQPADQSAVENRPRPDLIGRVQRADGQPASATVFIDSAGPKVGTSPYCPSCYADCRKKAKTDSSGNFKIESLDPDLLFRILVVGDGYKPKYVAHVDPGHKPVEVSLASLNLAETPPGQILRGRVLGANGAPIEGAAVQALGLRTKDSGTWGEIEGLDPLAVSDARGNFVITSRQPFTSLDLKVEARGYSRRTFTQISGGEPSHDLQLTEGAAIHGRLMMGRKPLASVSVGVVSEDRSENFTGDFEVGTDAEGRFAFVNLPPNVRYHLYGLMSALKAYGATPILSVEAGGDGSTTDAGDLQVARGNRINGWVVYPDHTIRPKTRLLVGPEDAWDSQLVELAKDGSFEVSGIPNGVVSLTVDVQGARLSAKNASIDQINPFQLVGRVDHDITNLVIMLEHGPTLEPQNRYYADPKNLPELQGAEPATDHSHERMISGRVTDAATGEPIASFRVTPGFSLYGDPDCDPSQAVDAMNGAYAVYFNKMTRDPLVKIEANGYIPVISQESSPGATSWDFVMTKGKTPDAVLLGDPAGTRPAGFLIDLGQRTPSAEQAILDERESLDKRRRVAFAKSEPAISEAGTTIPANSAFVKYLSDPPWIKQMIFAEWQLDWAADKPGDPETAKWELDTNLAAIQPSGFFEQSLTASPFGEEPGHKRMCGQFESHFWNSVDTLSGGQILYRTGTNITRGAGREAYLQQIRHLGLPALRPNFFKLGDNGEFSSETRKGESLTGRFLKVGASRPLALTYTVGNRTNEVFQVNYGYSSQNELPSYMEISTPTVINNIRTTRTQFVSITRIDYGIDPRISTGYRPTQFYADMHTFANIQVFRDEGRFSVEPNGVQTKINR